MENVIRSKRCDKFLSRCLKIEWLPDFDEIGMCASGSYLRFWHPWSTKMLPHELFVPILILKKTPNVFCSYDFCVINTRTKNYRQEELSPPRATPYTHLKSGATKKLTRFVTRRRQRFSVLYDWLRGLVVHRIFDARRSARTVYAWPLQRSPLVKTAVETRRKGVSLRARYTTPGQRDARG